MKQTISSADNPVLACLGSPRRRHILRILIDRSSPIGLRELATNLAAEEQPQELVDVTRKEVNTIQADLIHVHLLKLEAAGLIDWDQSADTVTTTNHPALEDPKLQQMIATNADGWEAIAENLASKRRRIILAALKDADRSLARADLAKRVVTREHDSVEDTRAAADALLTELHHIHLPKLEQADLISYDTDTATADYLGHPELDSEWLEFRPHETPRAILPAAQHPDDVWTIEGRDNVIARGQSLFEQADDELFLMFTEAGLLEEGCIRRMQEAVDRGVDIYLGSQTREIRDLVRQAALEVTIWEPQLDWLNLPPDHEKVGRLVMADREAIMLGTLGEEPGDGGYYEEKALTGTGENNPLVMLMREMLGSRLDHLDAQSEDFLDQLPL